MIRFFAVVAACCLFVMSCNTSNGLPQEKKLIFPSDQWLFSGPEEVGLSRDSLSKALGYLASYCGKDGLDQTIVIKNGYIVFAGDSTHRHHNIYSSTKSLTSTALGLLIEDGQVSLDDKAAKYEPLLQDFYPEVTLRHFATMTSGYSAKGASRWKEPSEDWSWTPYAPDSPMFPPGSAFAYWDEAQMMYGRVLLKAAGRDLYSLLDERLMKPIGVNQWDWWAEDTLTLSDGTVAPLRNGCTGIDVNVLDFGRIGWLFANQGVWNGDTLLSPAFVREAMTVQVPATTIIADTDRSEVKGPGVYGYNWWTATPNGGGEHTMDNSPADAAYMSGFNHNVCMVVPSKNLVIIRMGEDGNPEFGKHWVWDGFLRILL